MGGGGGGAGMGSHSCRNLAASSAFGDHRQLHNAVGKGFQSQDLPWACCCLGGHCNKDLITSQFLLVKEDAINFSPACHCEPRVRWGCSRSRCAQIQQAGAATSEGQAGDSSSRPGTAAASAAAGGAGAAEAAPSTSATADGESLEEAVLQNANQLYR